MDKIKITNFMLKLAKDARKIVKKHKNFNKMDKGFRDVVTDVDLLVEKHCINVINKKYPNTTIVSEEFNNNVSVTDNCFLIDPIDGTKNFANNLPFWGFQMAYMEKGKVISCVIDLPELNTQIKSIDGIGTFCNNQKIEPKPNNIEHSYWIVEGHSKKWKMATELSKDVMAERSFGCTSVTLGLVAKGEVCCIINTWNNAWDIYPGITACKNAGMVVIEEDKNIIIAPSNELAEYGLKITKTVK